MIPAMTLGLPGPLPASSLPTRGWKKVGPQGRIPVLRTPLPPDMGLVGAVQTGNPPPPARHHLGQQETGGALPLGTEGHPSHKGSAQCLWTVLPPGGRSHCCSALCAPCCQLSPGNCICTLWPCTVQAMASHLLSNLHPPPPEVKPTK